jgi:hypothetical protein
MLCLSATSSGQNVTINNFEPVVPTFAYRYGLTYENVPNPSAIGNSTANCAKIGSTTANWHKLLDIPVTFTVAANTTKYIHLKAMCNVTPDILVSGDATAGGDGNIFLNPITAFTGSGLWEDLVFKIDGGTSGIAPFKIIILSDVGQKLGNQVNCLYVDEIILSNTTVLGINKFKKNNSIAVYPNPTKNSWNFTSDNTDISSVKITNVLGQTVLSRNSSSNNVTIATSALSKGMYFAEITSGDSVLIRMYY